MEKTQLELILSLILSIIVSLVFPILLIIMFHRFRYDINSQKCDNDCSSFLFPKCDTIVSNTTVYCKN